MNVIFSNHILNISVLGFSIAQILKVILVLAVNKRLDFSRLVGSGGMPSSHTSLVASLTAGVGYYFGFSDPIFAVCAVLGIIVMYDASGVRRAAGEQAKILNRIMKDWSSAKPGQIEKELKELLGHTKKEVIAGMILGIIIATVYYYCSGGFVK